MHAQTQMCRAQHQHEGICKLLSVFKTTLLEPLHNLMGIPPIPYLLTKLLNAYTHRLRAMPPNALVHMVLEIDQCHVWPDYFIPPTNLHSVSVNIGTPTYRPIGPCTAGTWTHPNLLYNPNPSDTATLHHKEALIHPVPSDTYIFCFHVTHESTHFRCYLIYRQRRVMHSSWQTVADRLSAALTSWVIRLEGSTSSVGEEYITPWSSP